MSINNVRNETDPDFMPENLLTSITSIGKLKERTKVMNALKDGKDLYLIPHPDGLGDIFVTEEKPNLPNLDGLLDTTKAGVLFNQDASARIALQRGEILGLRMEGGSQENPYQINVYRLGGNVRAEDDERGQWHRG